MSLELIIRCTICKAEVDMYPLDSEDHALHVCEIAGYLDFEHRCSSEPHIVGTEGPTDENDPAGRFHPLKEKKS